MKYMVYVERENNSRYDSNYCKLIVINKNNKKKSLKDQNNIKLLQK